MVSGGHEKKPRAGAARIGVFKNSAPGLKSSLLFSSFFLLVDFSLLEMPKSPPASARVPLPSELQTHQANLQLDISAETSNRHLKLNTSQTQLLTPTSVTPPPPCSSLNDASNPPTK